MSNIQWYKGQLSKEKGANRMLKSRVEKAEVEVEEMELKWNAEVRSNITLMASIHSNRKLQSKLDIAVEALEAIRVIPVNEKYRAFDGYHNLGGYHQEVADKSIEALEEIRSEDPK